MTADGNWDKRGNKEPDVLIRVLGSTLALLSFAVVCIAGLLQGHSFASVVKSALGALAAGGAVGVLLACVVRVVAREGFDQQFREVAPPAPPAAPAPPARGAVQPGTAQESAPPAPAPPTAPRQPAPPAPASRN